MSQSVGEQEGLDGDVVQLLVPDVASSYDQSVELQPSSCSETGPAHGRLHGRSQWQRRSRPARGSGREAAEHVVIGVHGECSERPQSLIPLSFLLFAHTNTYSAARQRFLCMSLVLCSFCFVDE